jgi:hypothetical protein
LSCRRIYQDLVDEHAFGGSYYSVRRFARRLDQSQSAPFRRMEVLAGQEAQVDFGTGAPILLPDGKRRRCHVVRVVLSYSHKAYSEVVFILHLSLLFEGTIGAADRERSPRT